MNEPNFNAGLWRLADPKISLASMASIFLGACAAAAVGTMDYSWLALTVVGIFAIEVAKNASGEIFDFDSGADLGIAPEDRSSFSGGKRVLVDGLLSRKQTIAIAATGYAIGIGIGLLIVAAREPAVLWIGVFGLICAYFYQAPPLRLSYRGFGELAVAICYGPLICIGTYLVQRGKIDTVPLLVSIPLGLLIAAFLWVDEFPDFTSDEKANKRTLVVHLGRRTASRLFPFIFGAAFGMLILLPVFGLPKQVVLGGIALIPAVLAVIRVWKTPEHTAKLIPAQRNALLAFVLYAALAGFSLLIA